MVLGGTDMGKSTAVRAFYETLRADHQSVAVIDGDPGESTLGVPTMLTAILPSGDPSRTPRPMSSPTHHQCCQDAPGRALRVPPSSTYFNVP